MGEVLAAQAWRTNAELVADVARVGYLRAHHRVLDPTWGKGIWWRRWVPEEGELVGSDIDPEASPSGRSVDFRKLPWPDASFDVVTLDGPYKLNGTDRGEGARYAVDVYASAESRIRTICEGIVECARVLRGSVLDEDHQPTSGFLLVKCQDMVNGGRVRWQSRIFADAGEKAGLELWDRFDRLGHRKQPTRYRTYCSTCGVRVQPKKPCRRHPHAAKERRVSPDQHAAHNTSHLLVFAKLPLAGKWQDVAQSATLEL